MGDRRSFAEVVGLVARLRAENGCPWDRAQDHRSLRPYLLGEAHEAIAAVESGDAVALADELGDLLLQVLLHSQIAAETGEFTLSDVVERLAEKLVRRHPHVFSGMASSPGDLQRAWEETKKCEGRPKLPLPTLLEARKLVARLAPGWMDQATFASQEEERGASVLAAIDVCWRSGTDPELALRKAMARLSSTREVT